MNGLRTSVLTVLLGSCAPAVAQTTAAQYKFDIPRQPLTAALAVFARETGFQIARFSDAGEPALTANPVSGIYTAERALDLLLAGSGFRYRFINDHTIGIVHIQPPAPESMSPKSETPASPAAPAPEVPKPAAKHLGFFAHLALLFAACGAGAAPGTACAQEAAPPSNGLEEIVVTAEKRESTVLKTAISLTAVSGHDLQEQGITSFATLAQEIPGISMKTAGPGQTEFEMRGLASSGGESPTVGFYLDDTPVTPPAGASNGKVVIDPNLYDLNRVEVLRGPQGTLYGAGSMGGTIKLLTNQPDLRTFAASAVGIASDTEGGGFNRGANAMLNIPILDDKVALRLVATDQYRSGWIDRIVLTNFPLEPNFSTQGSFTPGVGTIRGNVLAAAVSQDFHNVNVVREEGLRAILLIRPLDMLSVTTTAFYQRIDQGGMDLYDNPPGTLAHYQPADVAEPYSDNFDLLSTVVKLDFTGVQITSATSYWDRTSRQTQDGSEVWQDAFGEPTFTSGAAYIEIDKTRAFTQELRAASTGNGPLQWLAGGFYSKYTAEYEPAGIDEGFVTQYGFGTSNVYTAFEPTVVLQRALFGQASYQVMDDWKVAAGVRRYAYDSSVSATATGILGTPYGAAEATAKGINPSVTISFAPSSDFLAYGTAAKGFRPGGANVPVPQAPCANALAALGRTEAPLQFNSDSLWSYELGEKARLADSRLSINGSIYYEKWSGVQQQVTLTCGFFYTDNAASARAYGAELEVQAKLSSAWTASLNGGITHANLTSVTPGTGFNVGDRVQNVPNATASAALQYRAPVTPQFDFVGRLSGQYVGNRVDATYGINQLPGYNTEAGRAGLAGDRWSVFLFADNLTNRQVALSNTVSLIVNIPAVNRVATNQPRTLGLDFSYKF